MLYSIYCSLHWTHKLMAGMFFVQSMNFAIKLLDKCTTKHEIQTLLQTKSYRLRDYPNQILQVVWLFKLNHTGCATIQTKSYSFFTTNQTKSYQLCNYPNHILLVVQPCNHPDQILQIVRPSKPNHTGYATIQTNSFRLYDHPNQILLYHHPNQIIQVIRPSIQIIPAIRPSKPVKPHLTGCAIIQTKSHRLFDPLNQIILVKRASEPNHIHFIRPPKPNPTGYTTIQTKSYRLRPSKPILTATRKPNPYRFHKHRYTLKKRYFAC